MNRASGSESVFFSQGWVLDDVPAEGLSEAQLLARAVLRMGQGAPTARRFRGTRLERASLLLREALRREREGLEVNHTELWALNREEWSALQGDARSKKALLELASTLGIDPAPASAAVEALLAAISRELLPGLHAQLSLGLPAGLQQHFHFSQWQAWPRREAGVSALLESSRLAQFVTTARESMSKGAYLTALNGFMDVLVDMPDGWPRTLLGSEACRAAEKLAKAQAKDPLPTLRATLTLLERLSLHAPYDFDLCRLQSAMHMQAAVRLVNEEGHFLDAGMHLVRARLLDPLDGTPAQLLEHTWNALENLGRQLREGQRQGQVLNDEGTRLVRETRSFESVHAFASSEKGRSLAARARDAALGQSALRLGLAPFEPASRREVEALLHAVQTQDDSVRNMLGERCLRAYPTLTPATWGQLEGLHRQGVPLQPEVLAVLLPPPPPLTLDASGPEQMSVGWKQTCERGIASGRATPGRLWDPWVFTPWFFSTRSAWLKGAAALGLGLLVASAGTEMYRDWRQSRRNAAFARLMEALDAGVPVPALAAARDFLAWEPSGQDPHLSWFAQRFRTDEVRMLADAVRSGDDARLQQLSDELAGLEATLLRLEASSSRQIALTRGEDP